MSGCAPPKLAKVLLKFLSGKEHLQAFWGDVEEIYCDEVEDKGKLNAKCWYWRQVFRAIPSFCRWYGAQSFAKINNYIIMGMRSHWKSKVYSLITLFGLVLGLTLSTLIFRWVSHEMSYDRFHVNANHIYRVCEKRHLKDHISKSYWTPGLLAAALKKDFPEIQYTVRAAWTGERLIRRGDQLFYENRLLCVDRDFFKMFTFPFKQGNPERSIEEPYGIVLSESFAKKYFGDENPIGKSLQMENKYEFTVKGIIKDVPRNSDFKLDLLLPFKMVEKLGWNMKTWDFSMATTYLQLKPGTNLNLFKQKISKYIRKHKKDSNIELYLQPLTAIHLHSSGPADSNGELIQYVTIFSIIGILILVMACINYMNLATARAEMRAREIGIRKVVGASRKNLIGQFITEALLLTAFSLLVVPVVISCILPEFNQITGIHFNFKDFLEPNFLIFIFLISLLTGLTAGIYPALVLSAFKPRHILAKQSKGPNRGSKLRFFLVTIQITASLLLILNTHVMLRQTIYLKNLDLGIDKKRVAIIPLGISNRNNKAIYDSLKNNLISHPGTQSISASFTHPFNFGTPPLAITYNGERLDRDITINMTSVDFDYIENLRIKILEGRGFSRKYGEERHSLVVNKAFARLLGSDSPINKRIFLNNVPCTIVGMVQDFYTSAVTHTAIEPLILFLSETGINFIQVRFEGNNLAASITDLEKAWKKAAPNLPFQYEFLDTSFDDQFIWMENLSLILQYFTIIGIMIACLGLFGLSAFYAQRRSKEIGIRKVLGSTTSRLVFLLCKDYLRLVTTAILISWPLGFFILNRWLQNYPNRISLPLTSFLLSGILAFIITIAAVIFQSIRAASTSPVNAIRSE